MGVPRAHTGAIGCIVLMGFNVYRHYHMAGWELNILAHHRHSQHSVFRSNWEQKRSGPNTNIHKKIQLILTPSLYDTYGALCRFDFSFARSPRFRRAVLVLNYICFHHSLQRVRRKRDRAWKSCGCAADAWVHVYATCVATCASLCISLSTPTHTIAACRPGSTYVQ